MAAAMSEMLEISGESPSLVALHSNNSNKVESDCDVLLNGSVSFFFFFFFFYLHGQSTTFSLKLEGAHFSTEDPPTPYPGKVLPADLF